MEKIKKYSLDYFLTKLMVKRDENFLVIEGFKKSLKEGLELRVTDSYFNGAHIRDKEISLPDHGEYIDVRELIALVAEDFPNRARRYLANKKLRKLAFECPAWKGGDEKCLLL